MQISPSFTFLLVLVTSILSITVYAFCRGAVSRSPKIQNRKLNKIESLILIPFALIYHLVLVKFLIVCIGTENVVCFFSRSFEFVLGQNSFIDYMLQFYPQVNSCGGLSPLYFAFGVLLYYLVAVLCLPYLAGKILYRTTWCESSFHYLVWVIEAYKYFLKLSLIKVILPVVILFAVFFLVQSYVSIKVGVASLGIVLFISMIAKPLRNRIFVPTLAFVVLITVLTWFLAELLFCICLAIIYLPFYPIFQNLQEWISSSDVPEYLKDIKDGDFYYVADATLTDGKMVSGILRDCDYIGEQKKLESIILEKPVRWERFPKTETMTDIWQREISSEGYYLREKAIPGETFYIRTNSIVDINTTKVPRNFIYIFSSKQADLTPEFIAKFKKWFKSNHQKYVFTNIDVYLPSVMAQNRQAVRDLFPDKKYLLGRIELYSVDNEDFMNFLRKAVFRKPQAKNLIIECNVEKIFISSPYFEGKHSVIPWLKQSLLSAKKTP